MPDHPQPDPPPSPAVFAGGLSDLSSVPLAAEYQELFERAQARAGGGAVWRLRKSAELREFLAMAQLSGRIVPLDIDLVADLRLLFAMQVPVPTLPDPAGELIVRHRALIGLIYREEALRLPQAGYSFITILQPNHVWLPNVAPADPAFATFGPGQILCLGAEVAPGLPIRELILQTFGALVLGSVQLDPQDAAGLMNPAAARWWLENKHRMPLTRLGLLEHEPEPEFESTIIP